jgi:hypothetical protein
MFECGFRVLLCTGRPEKFREITDSWLSKHGIKYHEMRMRKDDDVRSDAIIKSELVEDIEPDQILFVVEDRARVTDMWRQKGVTCLQCDYGDF